jgi:ABC-type phosphate transport system auxiliary subunit
MSDSGEGLVDASTRLAERMDELEEERRQARNGAKRVDPARARAMESLRLAKADIGRQLASVLHEARRKQLALALAEVERRLADLERTA